MKQTIIVIGREFGSGGHEIGEIIAKELGLNFYDRNMLDEIADEKEINNHEFHKFDEKPIVKLFSRHVRGHSSSMEEHLALMQFEFIANKVKEGESFVVVGRCADHVVKDEKGVITIFVYGDKLVKARRVMRKYNLDEVQAENKMARHDKLRKFYHNYYSDTKWGHPSTYDLCINSSKLGVEKTAEFLLEYIKERTENEE